MTVCGVVCPGSNRTCARPDIHGGEHRAVLTPYWSYVYWVGHKSPVNHSAMWPGWDGMLDKPRCPTCNSDDPDVKYEDTPRDPECFNPWHYDPDCRTLRRFS